MGPDLLGLMDDHMTWQFQPQGAEGFDGGHRVAVTCAQRNLSHHGPYPGAEMAGLPGLLWVSRKKASEVEGSPRLRAQHGQEPGRGAGEAGRMGGGGSEGSPERDREREGWRGADSKPH